MQKQPARRFTNDAADNTCVPFGVTMDLDDAPRFVDLGPCEFQGTTCMADLDGDQTAGFADLTQLLAG